MVETLQQPELQLVEEKIEVFEEFNQIAEYDPGANVGAGADIVEEKN